MTIKGNEACWDMLQRVFELAATHGGFDPSTLQAQFGSAVVEGNQNLQLEETVADREASPSPTRGGFAPAVSPEAGAPELPVEGSTLTGALVAGGVAPSSNEPLVLGTLTMPSKPCKVLLGNVIAPMVIVIVIVTETVISGGSPYL